MFRLSRWYIDNFGGALLLLLIPSADLYSVLVFEILFIVYRFLIVRLFARCVFNGKRIKRSVLILF